MITAEDIQLLIPQKYPFIMVDKLLCYNEITSRAAFKIEADNIFVENGEFKEPGLVESIAQTAAARAGYISRTEGSPVLTGYIGAIKNLEIFSFPKIGDELVSEITIEKQIFDVTLISGKITCNGNIIAKCEMKIFINPQTKNS